MSYREGEPLPKLQFDASLDLGFFKKLWRPFKYAVAGLLAAFCLLYAVDYLSLRLAIPRGRERFGTVQVRHYYAIAEKNNRVEFQFDPPEDQACVHSIFPHLGDQPCWYVKRHLLVEVQR